MRNLIKGLSYPFLSIGYFIKYPKLISLSVIPFLINLILYSLIFFSSLYFIKPKLKVISGLENNPKTVNYILYILISAIVFFIILILCYIVFTILSGIITGPFNENISRFIEKKITNVITVSNYGFFKDIFLSIKSEVSKILFYIIVITLLIVIGFIPIIGSAFTLIFLFLFSSFYSALDFLDYPMARKNYSLKRKIKSVILKPSLSFGFGLIASLILVIPFINILFKPLFVVSGTSLYFKENYN